MAEIYRSDIVRVDLDHALLRKHVGSVLVTGDKLGNRFGAEIFRDGNPVDVTGCGVTAYFMRPGEDAIVLNGTASGSVAYVDLAQACYSKASSFTLTIKISYGGSTTALRVIDGYILLTQTDELIDPGDVVPTLDDLLAQIAAMEQGTAAANAAAEAANTAAANAQEFIVTVTTPAYILDGDMSGIKADKTYAEIQAAINAGKTPVVKLKTSGQAQTKILHLSMIAPVSIVFREHTQEPSTYNVAGSARCTFLSTGGIIWDAVEFHTVPDSGTEGQVLVKTGDSTYGWRDPEKTAPPIIPTAQGTGIVAISDSANRPLAGLRLYGKTTQNGTPTPAAHVPLVNVGAGGNSGVYARGKNLIDMRGAAGGTDSGITVTVNADGSYTINGTATDINVNVWFAGYFNANAPTLFILPAGTYYVEGVALFSGTAFVSNNYQINGAFFTIAEDTPITGVRCTFVTSGQTYSNTVVYPIVAAGNEVAAFEPYKDGGSLTASTPNGLPGIPVTSGGNYVDEHGQQWVCDEIDFGRGVYVKNTKTVVLTGAEQVVTFDGWHAGSYLIESGYDNAYTVPPEQTNERVLCTHATAKNAHNVAVNGYIGVSVTNKGLTLCLSYDHARADDLKAYLSAQYAAGKPVQVAYALAEPIVTPIPADELAAYRAMTSQYPNTTVYNDSGAGMQVDYIADTQRYIDGKLAAIAAATL